MSNNQNLDKEETLLIKEPDTELGKDEESPLNKPDDETSSEDSDDSNHSSEEQDIMESKTNLDETNKNSSRPNMV